MPPSSLRALPPSRGAHRSPAAALALLLLLLLLLLALAVPRARAACASVAYSESGGSELELDAASGTTNLCRVLSGGAAHNKTHLIVYTSHTTMLGADTGVVRDSSGVTVLSMHAGLSSTDTYHVVVATNATIEMNGTSSSSSFFGWQWLSSTNLTEALTHVGNTSADANLFNMIDHQVRYFYMSTPSGSVDLQVNSYWGSTTTAFGFYLYDPATIFQQVRAAYNLSAPATGTGQKALRVANSARTEWIVAVWADDASGMSMVTGAAQCSSPTFTNSSGEFNDGSSYWSYADSCSFSIQPTGAAFVGINVTRADIGTNTAISVQAGPNTYGPYSRQTLPSTFFIMAPGTTFTLTSSTGGTQNFDGINGTFFAPGGIAPSLVSTTNTFTRSLSASGGPLIAAFETGSSTSVTLEFVVTSPNGIIAGLMHVLVRHFALPQENIYDMRIVHSSQLAGPGDFSFTTSTASSTTGTATLTGLVSNSIYYLVVARGVTAPASFDVTVGVYAGGSNSVALTIGISVAAMVLVVVVVAGTVTGVRRARRRKMARAHPISNQPQELQVVYTDNGYFAVPVSQIDDQTMAPVGQFSFSSNGPLLSPDVSISMMQSLRMTSLAAPGQAPSAPSVSVEEADEENMPDVVVTHWQKGSLLGRGGFGRVYMGLNLDTGEIIAVKQIQIGGLDGMSNDDYQMVRQEVNLMRQLKHKNIVRYLGCERTEEDLNIFLEFVPGGSLASIISRFGHLSEDVIKVYCRQILQGLRYLHAKGVIHRDIKGANILVGRNSCCKLADFGASRELEGMMSRASIKGTPYFMAPEVIQQRRTTSAADIWSFGCTVIEMATGRPPFADSVNQIAVMFAITSGTEAIPIPQDLSPAGQDFVQSCLNRNPEARPSADELLHHPFLAESDSLVSPMALMPGAVATPNSAASSAQHSGRFSSNDALPEQPPLPVVSSADGPRRLGQFNAGDDDAEESEESDDTEGESNEQRPKPAGDNADDDESSSFSSTTSDDDDDDDDGAASGAGAGPMSNMEAMLRA